MSRIIEIHALETLPPNALNRGEDGSVKTANYGGVTRMRVSSQAWKKAMRRDFRKYFKNTDLADNYALRSREFRAIIIDRLGITADEETIDNTTYELAVALGLIENKAANKKAYMNKDEAYGQIPTMIYISKRAWDEIATVARKAIEAGDDYKTIIKENKKNLMTFLENDIVSEIALFGRMLASKETKGSSNAYDLDVDAAAQTAHALSVDRAVPKIDYFTAVDDSQMNASGAAHIGEKSFVSGTLYRYANIDVNLLRENLKNDEELVKQTISAWANAFVYSMPTGSQNAFAADVLPEAVMIVVRDGQAVNLMGAFTKPISGTVKDGDVTYTRSIPTEAMLAMWAAEGALADYGIVNDDISLFMNRSIIEENEKTAPIYAVTDTMNKVIENGVNAAMA